MIVRKVWINSLLENSPLELNPDMNLIVGESGVGNTAFVDAFVDVFELHGSPSIFTFLLSKEKDVCRAEYKYAGDRVRGYITSSEGKEVKFEALWEGVHCFNPSLYSDSDLAFLSLPSVFPENKPLFRIHEQFLKAFPSSVDGLLLDKKVSLVQMGVGVPFLLWSYEQKIVFVFLVKLEMFLHSGGGIFLIDAYLDILPLNVLEVLMDIMYANLAKIQFVIVSSSSYILDRIPLKDRFVFPPLRVGNNVS